MGGWGEGLMNRSCLLIKGATSSVGAHNSFCA